MWAGPGANGRRGESSEDELRDRREAGNDYSFTHPRKTSCTGIGAVGEER